MQNYITQQIRTYIPYVIGAVVAWLTQKGVHVPDSSVASATAALTLVFGSVYYLVVSYLERKFPKLGILLGVPKKPTY